MNLNRGLPPRCEMLSTVPVTKLSMPMALCPRASSRSTRCEPRKPAAPVTTEVGADGPGPWILFLRIEFQWSNRSASRYAVGGDSQVERFDAARGRHSHITRQVSL